MVMLATHSNVTHGRGNAELSAELVSGQTTVTSVKSSEPIKILVPKSRGASVWAFTSNFGGGMVNGDNTQLGLTLGPGTCCFLGTQASTKIYRNPQGRPCSHTTRATLAEKSLLVFAPDPIQAFAGSSYSQRQEFHLSSSAGLVLLDWFTSGRAARGERWRFTRFRSRNDVFVGGERVFLDSILLEAQADLQLLEHRVGRFNCFATLLLAGDPLRAAAARMLDNISATPVGKKERSSLVVGASPIRGGAVLRIAGEQVEAVGRTLHQHLSFAAEFLGDDPWLRKW